MESVTDYTTQCPDARCGGKIFNWETSTYDDCPYSYHNESEEEEEEDAMQCYYVKKMHRKKYSIGSGNYIIVDFDDDGEQCAVYKSSDYGKINTLVNELLVITHNKHGEQLIKLVSEDYDLNDEKDESLDIE